MAVVEQAAGIEKFHTLYADRVRELLLGELYWITTPAGGWDKPHYQGDVVFELASRYYAVSQAVGRQGVQLMQFNGVQDTFWLSWREEWTTVRGERTFELAGAGVTVYWGPANAVGDVLFRAEWDAVAGDGVVAAQPHWHIDSEYPISIQRLHLGMSGWLAGDEFPRCWQTRARNSDDVRKWACQLLRHLHHQLSEYYPCPAPR